MVVSQDMQLIDPPADLLKQVMTRIDKEQTLAILRKQLYGILVVAGFVCVATVRIVFLLIRESMQAGFAQYVHLLVSDFNAVISYWQDFVLSLLESLPVFRLAEALAVTLMLAIIFRMIVVYAKEMFNLRYKQEQSI